MTNVPAELRREYQLDSLDESQMAGDPFEQFEVWFNQALKAGVAEPNAMTLATADLSGKPSARIVLLKGFDPRGFMFFTNYDSRKGREMQENPRAALCFHWQLLERQVRIEGKIEKVSRHESEEYFHSRPRERRSGRGLRVRAKWWHRAKRWKKRIGNCRRGLRARRCRCRIIGAGIA